MRGDQGPGIPATPLVRTPVTTWSIGHCTVSSEPFLGTVPARLWVGRPVPPLDHHGEPALNVVFKAPPGVDPWPLQPPQSSCVCAGTLPASTQNGPDT